MWIAEACQPGEAGEQFPLARNPPDRCERGDHFAQRAALRLIGRIPANFPKPVSGQRGPFPVLT